MRTECSHGVEWDINCPHCEIISCNEEIKHAEDALNRANSRKVKALREIEEHKRAINEAMEGVA